MQLREGPGGRTLIVSATDLVGFLECGHLSALDLAVARGELDKPYLKDATLDLIRDRGGRHEERYIVQLEQEQGRRVTRLNGDWSRPYEERQAETVAAMERGDDVIYQATVFDGRWVGHPDFLLRVDTPRPSALSRRPYSAETDGPDTPASRGAAAYGQLELPLGDGNGLPDATSARPGGLGTDWHYEVADTKLAHSAKASALLQICSYVDQVARLQGVTPGEGVRGHRRSRDRRRPLPDGRDDGLLPRCQGALRAGPQPPASTTPRATPSRPSIATSAAGSSHANNAGTRTTPCPSWPASRAASARICARSASRRAARWPMRAPG